MRNVVSLMAILKKQNRKNNNNKTQYKTKANKQKLTNELTKVYISCE